MKDRIDRMFLKMTLALLALPCSLAYGTDGNGGDDLGAIFLGNSLDFSVTNPSDSFELGALATSFGANPVNPFA